LAFCNLLERVLTVPNGAGRFPVWRTATIAASLTLSLCLTVEPALAQGIDLVRDTEIERTL
jgi:hypothetical protein